MMDFHKWYLHVFVVTFCVCSIIYVVMTSLTVFQPQTLRKSVVIKKNPYTKTNLSFKITNEHVKCYRARSKSTLPVMEQKLNETQKPIFFIESSCKSFEARKIVLNPRQACSIESAARMNPGRQVYVLFVSPAAVDDENGTDVSDNVIRAVLNYSNVLLRHIDYKSFVHNSAVAPVFERGALERSYYPVEHSSDILRILTLWKYGGIYLDLDVVSMKSLDELHDNFGVYQESASIVNGVMGFRKEGIGHAFLGMCLDDIKNHFDGHAWGENGPDLITRYSPTIW